MMQCPSLSSFKMLSVTSHRVAVLLLSCPPVVLELQPGVLVDFVLWALEAPLRPQLFPVMNIGTLPLSLDRMFELQGQK